MPVITDEYMQQRISHARAYTLVILKVTEKRKAAGADLIVWEHARRNMSLGAEGTLPVVCPVSDGTEVCGIGIFNAGLDETKKMMDDDPGVKSGIFVYETHPCRGFPGSTLP